MFNIKNVAILALALSGLLVANSGSHPTSSTGGYTAAPGDGVCSQCHTSNNTALDGDYTVSGVPADIEPNTTYTVDIQLTNPNGNAVRGGFQIVALKEVGNVQAGTWSNASTGSVLKTSVGKTYLGHQGIQSFPASNELNWTADWTSPDQDDATFNFYAVSILGNGANSNQNDRFLIQQFDASTPAVAMPLMLSIALVSDASCANSTDGSATVTITGGEAPYDILWENGETTETATMLPVGNTFVVVTDATGFSTEVEIDIDFSVVLEIMIEDLNDATCFATANGSVSVTVPNGVDPINYEWSNGATGNAIDNVFSGMYSVTATDANDCNVSLDITIAEPDDFDVISTITIPSCNGGNDGSIFLDVTGGTIPYSFLWEDASQNNTLFNLAAGTYLTTITDINDCSIIISTEVTEPLALDITNTVITNPICSGDNTGSISVTPVGGTPDYLYNWSNGESTPTITDLTAGDYLLTVTDSEDCSTMETYTITDQIDLVISTTSTSESSPGASDGTVTVNVISGGDAPYDYLWSTDDDTETVNNLTAGNYSVTVSDANGCNAEGTVSISSGNCSLEANVEVLPITCNGANDGIAMVTLMNFMEPIFYTWSDGSTEAGRTDLEPGTYSLIVLDSAGCSDTLMNIIITQPEALTVDIDVVASNECGNDDSGVLEAIVTGGTLNYSYEWSNDDSNSITDSLPDNDYFVTVTDNNGCTATAMSSISSENDITPPTLILQDLIVYATLDGFDEITAAQFDNGSTDNCSDVDFEFVNVPMLGCDFLGTQVLSIIGIDTLNNSDTMDITLTLIDTLPPTLSDGQIDIVDLEGCEPFLFDLPVATDNCSDEVIVEKISGFDSGQIFPVGSTEQVYSFTDISGNQTMYSFVINVTSDLDANITVGEVNCFGETNGSISIEATGTHNPFVQDSSIVDSALAAGDYLVTIRDTVGCQILEIVNIPEPSELIGQTISTPATDEFTTDGEISITVEGGIEPYTIRLFDADGEEVPANEVGVFTDLVSGVYNGLIVDENGCEISIPNIEVQFTTSTTDLIESYGIETYPNPINDQLTISIKEKAIDLTLSIKSIDGKIVWFDKGKTGMTFIDLSEQPNGLYMLSITDKKVTTTRKISVLH